MVLALSACTLRPDPIRESPRMKSVTITAGFVAEPDTKLSFSDMQTGAMTAYWEAADLLGVTTSAAGAGIASLENSLESPAASAVFTGEISCTAGETLYAYAPYRGTDSDITSLPLSMTGQMQTSDGSTAHLGAYDFLLASPTVLNESLDISLTFSRIVSVMRFDITLPVGVGKVMGVSVKSADNDFCFISHAAVDATKNAAEALTSVTTTDEIYVIIDNLAPGADNKFTAYLMFIPVNLTGKSMTVTVATDLGGYSITKSGKEFLVGSRCRVELDMSSVTPSGVKYWDGESSAEPSVNGAGKYEVSTPAHLKWIRNQTSAALSGKEYILTSDISLSHRPWTPIRIVRFVFDGNGHTISGLHIDDTTPNMAYMGLFASISGTGEVKNLNVRGNVSTTGQMAGGICSYNIGKVIGCSMTGNVIGLDYVGGISGEVKTGGTIQECTFTGNVKATTTGTKHVGTIYGADANL